MLRLQEQSITCHNHHAASKSRRNSKNQSIGQARTYKYRLEQTKSIGDLKEPSRAI